MMTLLQPGAWGVVLGVLALPVLIHLWSRRPARVVAIGSTRLLAGAKPTQARRLALTDLPLLALRLLVLACAGLALLGFSWQRTAATPVRVALLAEDTGPSRRADSLAAEGWLVHWLAPGLPMAEGAAPPVAATAPIWSLLRDAARRFPSADTVLVVAPLSAASLDGVRPVLPFAVRLLSVAGAAAPAADTLAVCLESSASGSADSVRLLVALQSIGDAAGRPVQLLGPPCAATPVPALVLRAGAGMLGTLPREPESGRWPLDPAALRDPAIIDALSSLLGVRDGERREIVLPTDAAMPGRSTQTAGTTAAPWHLPLSAAALLLFAAERLLAARRSGAPRA